MQNSTTVSILVIVIISRILKKPKLSEWLWPVKSWIIFLDHPSPNTPTTLLRQWGFHQCLPFSWTKLRCKDCQYPIAVMGVVDTFRPVQLLEFMKNFKQHPALVYCSAYTIFGTVTLWRFDALPATLESFKIWISDCTQRKVQLWPVIKNRPLLFFSGIMIG